MKNKLDYLGIAEISELIRLEQLSPVEVVKHCLGRIETFNKKLNAFISVLEQQALKEARKSAREIKKGNWKGRLHGIPVAVKDFYDTAGIRTTGASEQLKDRKPKKDAEIVSRLKEAGAILVGKTNMHTLGMGTTSLDSYFGSVRNPWNVRYVAGGSSGGSAAAVASGMCYATVDTDAIGSCRIPAACCGVTGLKVSNGLFSMKGILEGEKTDPMILVLSAPGISTRSVEDSAILLDTLTNDPKNKYYEALFSDQKLKIGVVENFKASREIKNSFNESVSVLQSLGFELTTVEVPFSNASFHLNNVEADRAGVASTLFQKVDVVILPTLTSPTLTVKEAKSKGPQAVEVDNTFFCNYFGLPALSLCCGFDVNGMPLALQIVGLPQHENYVLYVSHAYQKASDRQLIGPNFIT